MAPSGSVPAIGPDFRRGFASDAPAGNADIGKTIAHLLRLKIPFHGQLQGRVIEEVLPGGEMPAIATATLRSPPAANGLETILLFQQVGTTRYFDAAGFAGRTVGLTLHKSANELVMPAKAGIQ